LVAPSNTGSTTSAPSLPVKNTFIHFEGQQGSSRRCLRRWRTDPEELPPLSLSGLKSERASTASLAPSSAGSTIAPVSEVDVLEPAIGSLGALDFEGFNSPETTPRCVRHPWASTPEKASSPHVLQVQPSTIAVPMTSPSTPFGAHARATPAPTPASSTSLSSSVSSSPASSTYLDAAFSSLSSAGRQAPFLEGGYCFGFTLRLADDVGLGVDLGPCWDGGQALCVQEILQNGAVAAWNKQCFDGTTMRLKAVFPGDTIVGVNGKTEYLDMIHECKNKMLLKLTVFRPDGATVPTDCYWSTVQSRGLMVQRHGREGDRLHSCKKPVVLSTKP